MVVNTRAVHGVEVLKVYLIGAVLEVLVCSPCILLDIRYVISFFEKLRFIYATLVFHDIRYLY